MASCGLSLVVAQDQPPAEDPRLSELRAQLEEANHKVKTLSNANAVLGESLTESNRKLKELEEAYKSAVLHLELLGVESINTEAKGMQERLKKAVSDLRLIEEEKAKIAQASMNLSTAVLAYMKSAESSDADARKEVEKSLRESDSALGVVFDNGILPERTLEEAKVISVKQELNLVVIDVGKKQGLVTGTPIRIQRKDRMIASGLVVDVREGISGAVLREVTDAKDGVKLGDQISLVVSGS